MVLEFYYDKLSEPCRAVYLFLKGTGVEFESKIVELLKGQQHEPQFVEKTPIRKIPLIGDNGFVLVESVAIMRYIAIKHNVPDHWFPRKDLQKAAKIDEYLYWHHLNIRKPVVDIFLNLMLSRISLSEHEPKAPLDEKVVTIAWEELTKSLNLLADYFLKDQPYLCGYEISAADLLGVTELVHLSTVNESEVYEKKPAITAWIKRVEERMQPHYEEATAGLIGLNEIFNNAGTSQE